MRAAQGRFQGLDLMFSDPYNSLKVGSCPMWPVGDLPGGGLPAGLPALRQGCHHSMCRDSGIATVQVLHPIWSRSRRSACTGGDVAGRFRW